MSYSEIRSRIDTLIVDVENIDNKKVDSKKLNYVIETIFDINSKIKNEDNLSIDDIICDILYMEREVNRIKNI